MNTGQIIKSRSTNKNAVIPNAIAQSKELSLSDKGLIVYLLSLPSDWVINKSNLHTLLNEKKGTVDSSFKNLQNLGYIISAKIIDEKGRFKGWNHVVYDEPVLSDINNNRSRNLPKSEFTEVGKNAPIQIHNINGLQGIERNTEKEKVKKEKADKSAQPPPPKKSFPPPPPDEIGLGTGELYALVAEIFKKNTTLTQGVPKEELRKFVRYWTETSKQGIERWKTEKFFDVARRIKTWRNNYEKHQAASAPEQREKRHDPHYFV